MTAIADIIVNPQISELQLSNSNQKSQISSSSVSFQDYLASLKPEESKPVQKSDDYSNKVENNHYDEKESAKETEKSYSEEKVETPVESVQKTNDSENKSEEINQSAEKTNDSENEASVSEKKVENKKITSETSELKDKNVKTDEKSLDLQKILEGKTAKTSNENNEKSEKTGDNKKSLKNDFSRLDELLAEKEISTEELIDSEKNIAELQSAADGNGLLKSTESELAENKSSKGTETDVETIEDNLIASRTKSEVKDFSEELNLENGNPRISKLDKDGKITVEDFRTEIPVEKSSESKNSELKTQIKYDGDNSATITMELAQNADANLRSMNTQVSSSNGSNFQAMLNNQIQNNAQDFVKAGTIVLKDNDKGTINLVLRPDELGNVKIHLSMDGKTVHGHITVNSKEALQVFKDNAETLREAFIKNGFDAANFDVAYNNNSSGQNQEFNQQFTDSQFVAKKAYGESAVGEGISDGIIFEENENFSKYSVNIVA